MKKQFFLIICLLQGIFLPQNKYFSPDDNSYVNINEQTIEFGYDYGGKENKNIVIKKEKYKINNNEKYFTEIILERSKYFLFNFSEGNDNFLWLVNSVNDNQYYINNIQTYSNSKNKNYRTLPSLTPVDIENVSGFVQEKINNNIISYKPDFCSFTEIPWAINNTEKIKTLDISCNPSYNDKYQAINYLIISNGFVSCSKPYLYEQNARVKTLEITINKKKKMVNLLDTPNFQKVELPEFIELNDSEIIHIEIKDIYPGTKYSDIAISAILFPEIHLK